MRRAWPTATVAALIAVPLLLTLSARPLPVYGSIGQDLNLSWVAVDNLTNILLLIPAAAAIRAAWRVPFIVLVGGGTLFSLGVETVQWAFLPGRDATFRDVAMNTIGATIGWTIGVTVAQLRRVRTS